MLESVSIPNAALSEILSQLTGTVAWGGKAGNGTGSIFTVQFGPALSSDEKWGDFSLMVYCAWRLVEANRILLSWHDDADAVLAPGLLALEGLTVDATKLSKWNDLTIRFTNSQELQVMNDFSPFKDADTAWFMGYRGHSFYCVNSDNSIVIEAANR